MGEFIIFLLILAIAYLLWRISDQVPDILFRLSEIQRDIAEIRRRGESHADPQGNDLPADSEPSSEIS
jgi:hypothetical protein